MLYLIIKYFTSAFLIVTISEVAKRSNFLGAVLASIPLLSVLAFIWLYIDTQNTQLVANLAKNIFWLVIPSLILFLALPFFLHNNMNFYIALLLSLIIMVIFYFIMYFVLKKFGINL